MRARFSRQPIMNRTFFCFIHLLMKMDNIYKLLENKRLNRRRFRSVMLLLKFIEKPVKRVGMNNNNK